MSKNNRKWTEREDAIVLSAVKSCPNNLTQAFQAASHTLGNRTPGSCSYRWYSCISKRTDKKSIALTCFSEQSYNINRKNCKTPIEANRSQGFKLLWNRIIGFFGV